MNEPDETTASGGAGRRGLPGWLAALVAVFVIVPMTAVIVWSLFLSDGAWVYLACLAPLELLLIYVVGTSPSTASLIQRRAPFGRSARAEKTRQGPA